MPPQAQTPSTDDFSSTAGQYNGGTNFAARNAGLGCGFAMLVLVLSGPIFGCLYPLASATALAAGLTSRRDTLPY